MKKVILLIVICFGLSITLASCRDTKKAGHSEKAHEHDKDMASNDTYACPMDCEKKTYESEGACPVCNMVLKRIDDDKETRHEHDLDSEKPHEEKDHDSDESHEHASNERHAHDNDSLHKEHE